MPNPNQPGMSEQELLTDLLNEEKSLVKGYASDMTETASVSMRRLLLWNMTECSTDQYTVFEQMKNRNMYKVKTAPQPEITTAKQDMQTLRQQTGI